jgi:putative RNA 2'-phosphotransferase
MSRRLGMEALKTIYRCRVCGRYVEEPVHCGVRAEPVLDGRRRVMLSKLMSGLLRHYPWEAGLHMDRGGWVSIDELVEGIRSRWRNKELYQWVTREHVIAVAMLDPKGRFEIRDNMIRARYGHSVNVDIEYPVVEYSRPLYHGTSINSLSKIMIEGIKPMKRRYVHLTTSFEDARETGSRHGRPVVLVVDTSCLKEHELQLYKATDKIYLVKYVPPQCIKNRIYT